MVGKLKLKWQDGIQRIEDMEAETEEGITEVEAMEMAIEILEEKGEGNHQVLELAIGC